MPMKNNLLIEKIEAYLTGQLSEDEKKEFEINISENKEIREQVKFIQELKNIASQEGRKTLENKIKKAEEKYASSIESNNRRKKIKAFRIVSVAASLTILLSISITLYLSQNNQNQIYDEYFQTPENTFVSYARGSEKSKKIKLLTRAAKQYDRKNYQKAASIFNNQIELLPELSPYIFLAAMSNMQLNNTTEAKKQLEYLNKTKTNNFPSSYFLGLLHLKNGQTKTAIQYFNEAANDKNAYSQKATEIINRLD